MEVCRLCLSSECLNMYLDEDIFQKINSSFSISLSMSFSKLMPKKICDVCFAKIHDIYQYKNKVIETEKYFNFKSLIFSKYLEISENSDGATDPFPVRNVKEEYVNTNADLPPDPLSSNVRISKIYATTETQTDLSMIDLKIDNVTNVEINVKQEVEENDFQDQFENFVEEANLSTDDDKPLILRKKKNIPHDKFHIFTEIKQKKKNSGPKKRKTRQSNWESDDEDIIIDWENLDAKVKRELDELSLNNMRHWPCLICFIKLDTRSELLSHYKDHVKNPLKYIISECPRIDPLDDSLQITDSKNYTKVCVPEFCEAEVYQCRKCQKLAATESSIINHLKNHDDSRPFPCNKCGRSFAKITYLVRHGIVHNSKKSLFCTFPDCTYSTVYPVSLNCHKKVHDTSYKFKYVCDICGKGFDNESWYIEHQNIHTGIRPFVCDICGKDFVFSRYLGTHRNTVHPDKTTKKVRHHCYHCPKEFIHKFQLRKHLINKHGAENKERVLCDICGKGLTSKSHLVMHRRIHTGEKPYACNTCGKAFAKKCNLTLHERVHSGEKPYECEQCKKCFSQRTTLIVHSRLHTGVRPYNCQKCSKSFVSRGILSMHLKTCSFK